MTEETTKVSLDERQDDSASMDCESAKSKRAANLYAYPPFLSSRPKMDDVHRNTKGKFQSSVSKSMPSWFKLKTPIYTIKGNT